MSSSPWSRGPRVAGQSRAPLRVVGGDGFGATHGRTEGPAGTVCAFVGRAEFTRPADVARGVLSREYVNAVADGVRFWSGDTRLRPGVLRLDSPSDGCADAGPDASRGAEGLTAARWSGWRLHVGRVAACTLSLAMMSRNCPTNRGTSPSVAAAVGSIRPDVLAYHRYTRPSLRVCALIAPPIGALAWAVPRRGSTSGTGWTGRFRSAGAACRSTAAAAESTCWLKDSSSARTMRWVGSAALVSARNSAALATSAVLDT